MDKSDRRRADQRSSPTHTSANAPQLSGLTRAWLWGGRALVVLTLAVTFACWLDRPNWEAEGWNSPVFPRSPLPNITVVLLFATAILGQWLCGLAASPSAAWRDGADLVAETVVGRRRIPLPASRVIRFRVPTRGGSTHAALVIGRGLRVLMLVGPIAEGGRSRINGLVGRRVPSSSARTAVEYLVGLLWLLMVIAGTFVLVGLAGSALGILRA